MPVKTGGTWYTDWISFADWIGVSWAVVVVVVVCCRRAMTKKELQKELKRREREELRQVCGGSCNYLMYIVSTGY